MSNEYLRQSDLLALNTLSPEEDAEMRYAERLADRGGESPVSLQEEIRRAPNQKARDILLAEAAQRGGDYEQLQTPAPVKRRSNDWRAAIRESLGDGEMPDGPSFDEMLNGFKPEAAAKPVDTSTWGNVKRGFMVATEQMPQLAYGLAAFGASGLETMLGEGGISSAAKNWAVGKYQDWGAKIQANSSENDEFTTAYDKAKSGDFGALVDWLSYGVGYTLSQGAQMLATGGVGSLAGKAALKGSAEKLASGMVAKEAATLAAGKEVTEEITKAAVANVSSRLGQMGAIGAAAYGMEGGEIGGDLASMSAKEGRALTGAELARGLGATVLAGSLEFVGDKLGYDTILGKNKFGLGDVAGIKGKAARAVAGTVANVPAEFGTEYFQTGAENWGKGEEENILPFNQSEKAQMDALNSGALGAVGGAVHGVIGGAISRARNVDEAIDAANQELATGAQVSDAAKEADDALKSLQVGIADTRQIEDGVPAMAERAREMGMLEPQQRLLGYQAGEPLITFPDGTTMTRADYARTQMAADQARLDAMVQDAPLPGMMTRAQEMAQPIIDKAELDDLIAQERFDRGARIAETLSSQRSTKIDQALSGDSAQDDLIPSQPQPVERMVSAPQAIEQVAPRPVAQPQAPQQSEAIQKLQAKYDAAQEMGDSTMVRILSNEIKAAKLKEAKAAQPQPAQPVTPKAEQVFAMGSLPTNAEPITVKDGVVHVGNYPAQNFETGDDVTVPEGASKAQIAKALKDAGAIAKGQRVFGVLTETNATGPSEKAKEISRLIGEMGVLGWDAARVQRLIDEKGEAAADKTIASFKEHIASTNRLKNYDKHGGESVAARAEQPTQSAPTSGKAGEEQWAIRQYRYAKDKIAFDITGDGKWKGRLARLSEQVGGRYVNRARAYIMSEKQARKALDLYEKGYDASVFTGKLEAPKEAAATTPAQPGTTTENQSVAETKPAAPIADFGEKIGGARKDTWTSYKDKLGEVSDDEVISEPLSKSWPEPDYQKMLAEGADSWSVAFMRAARDEIPRKPTATWKQKRWAEQVKLLRSVTMRLVSGDISVDAAKTKLDEMRSAGMKRFASRVELYQLVGHDKSLAGIGFDEHYYSIYKGKDNVHLWVVEQDAKATAFSNWPRELATGSTKEEMLQAFKDKYASLDLGPAKKKAVSFDIYSRKDGGFWIGKKLGRNPLFVAGPFKTVAEARAYRDANNAELIAKLEKNKEIPNERRDTNNPRVGEDMRNGQDVTPQMFGEAFGFRGVEFGNWVEQTKRQKDLNDAYDALMDMAAVLGVPPKALSLNGELGLAFGARGSGGVHPAAAHYERDKVVINLTKKEGAGSLGHEWWHALDNYFQRLRGNKAGMATEALDVSLAARGSEFVANTAMRKEMVAAFGAVVKSIKETALKARSSKLDAKRSKEYWVTGPEMSARSFESYLISKLQDQNASNDYLANIVDDETWAAAEKLGFELEDSYPYPTAGEMPTIRAGFDRFFQAIQTKETDNGIAFYSQARATEKQAGVESKDLAASELPDSVRPVAQALGVISKLLGKNIVYRTNLGGDGMVMDSKTIYLDPERMDGIGAVQVFGHEFWHQVQMSHPEIWNAVVGQLESAGALTDSVMVEQYNDYFALTDDFNSKTEEQIIAELDQPFVDPEGGKHASLRTFLTQELMSDLAGNRFAESEFWTDVFAGLEAKEGHIKATTLIRRFVGALTKMLDKVLSYMKMQGFKADAMLQDHLTEVRSALAEGMAQYLHETQYGNEAARDSQKYGARFTTQRDYTDQKDGLQSFTVLVKQNGKSFRDGVTGPSREAAIKFAQWVWPAAEVEIVADRAFVPDLRYSTSRNQRLAPNGKPSKLNEQQWQQVRTPEFKSWFGDWEKYATMQGGVWNDGDGEVSKIVDENGEPLVVYHGSKKGGFTIMRPDKGDKHRSPMIFAAADRSVARTYSGYGDEIDLNTGLYEDDGTYDHQSDDYEEQRGIYSLFLNIRDPNEASFEGANWDGQRYDQYEVWDNENEEPIYSKGDRSVMSEDEAIELAESLGDDGRYEVRQASDHYETTNSVAEEAKRLGNDGAIIREVVDDGGQYGSADATDVFVFFDSNQAKSATQNTGAFSKTNDDLRYSTARLPDAIIANSLAETKGATYEAAKSGSATAAMKIAKQLVTPDLLNALRPLADDQPIAVGVVSIEATGRNALPQAGAAVIARSLGIEMDLGIVQSSKPKRTGMDGLDRIFARPEFSGDVVAGRGYVLVDDTITQGGTFAALDEHITENGGHVVAVVALTGKQYSSKLSPSEATLRQLRDKFGDIEDGFKQATGYGFDALTESEARYLANFKQADAIRARIAKESGETARRTAAENGLAEEQNQKAPPSGGVSYSTPRIIGDSGRQYDQGQRDAFKRTGRVVNDLTIGEKLAELRKDLAKKMLQGIVDQFAPIKELTSKGYMLARLSKGATGAFEAFMHHGKLSIKDGAYDADTSGGVMEKVFYKLGKETSDFLYWVAGNRAERLKMQGKENLFEKVDIDAYKRLSNGTTSFDYTLSNGKTTRDRTLIYKDALAQFNEFNKNVLDMAEQSGLIDGKSRHLWEHEFYVPFYRVMEDEDGAVRGGNIGKGLIRQQAFKKLKGGTEGLNDLLSNTLMNWAHLIDASAKNRAAAETLKAAERLGAARLAEHGEKKTVWFMEKGDKVEYKVDDPYLLTAINGLDYAGLRGPMMDILSKTKHWLTMGVTASPFFKVRNLIRDSVQAIATSDLGYNPIGNVIEGYKLTNRQRQEYVSALAGGGLIRFGTMLEGNEASRVRQLIKIGAKDEHILDGEGKISQFYDKYLEPAVTAYNEIGNRGEEINRMSLYDQLIKQGKSHAEASLMARDLMDFSMQGSFATIRFLTQVVPFMNARLQGMYKLGRAAKEDPAKMAVVLGAVTMASLALLAMYGDDDDWKKREDWDRDNYWWFKLGGTAFRIPKPFEIGAIATLAERSAEALFDSEMNGERYRKVTSNLILNQLAMNPVPQLVKPIIDIYANKDSFSGRPIETMGMEKLDPSYRFRQNTSMVARGISSAGNAVTGEHFLSPVQVDSAIRGYFSWLGAFVVGAADIAVRSASNEPTKPAVDYWKTATGGMVSDLDSASSRYVSSMYEQAKELEQAYGTYRSLIKEGKTTEAAEYREDNKEKLSKYREVENVKRAEAKLNERIRMIERSNMQADEKRDLINQIRKQQDVVARRVAPGA